MFSASPQAATLSDSPFTSASSSSLSSQTCSPWETCPGLAPASPLLFSSTVAGLRQAQGLQTAGHAGEKSFNSYGQSQAHAPAQQSENDVNQYIQERTHSKKRSIEELITDAGLTLDTSLDLGLNINLEDKIYLTEHVVSEGSFDDGSSFGRMTLQSPIHLNFQHSGHGTPPSITGGDSGGYYPGEENSNSPIFNAPQSTCGVLSAQTSCEASAGEPISQQSQMKYNVSSPLTPVDERRGLLPPVSPLSPESPHLRAPPSSQGVHDSRSVSPHSSLYTRAARRKVSNVNYAVDEYDSDSDGDYEYDGDYDGDEEREVGIVGRVAKRRRSAEADNGRQDANGKRARARSDASRLHKADSEGFLSPFVDDTLASASASVPSSNAALASYSSRSRNKSKPKPKQKSKRRHHCSRPNCHATFTRITDMERHLASVHRTREGDEPVDACRCAFCGKAFSREDAVLRHENDSCPVRVKKRRW